MDKRLTRDSSVEQIFLTLHTVSILTFLLFTGKLQNYSTTTMAFDENSVCPNLRVFVSTLYELCFFRECDFFLQSQSKELNWMAHEVFDTYIIFVE